MCAGFAFGTTTTSAFSANTTGFEHKRLAYSRFGRVMFAEAKTSAGAPWVICAASVFEPPNWYFSARSIFGKTSVSEARSEEHTSELQSHSFISYAVFCLK